MSKCIVCGTEFEARRPEAKTCSDKCRKRLQRSNKKPATVEPVKPKKEPSKKPKELTRTPEPIRVDNHHPLWKHDDPKEGTASFFMKYGCETYDELEEMRK